MVNKAKSAAIENELEGNKQNSRLLWKALKKLSLSGKVKSAMPNDFNASRRGGGGGGGGIKQVNLTGISSIASSIVETCYS